MSSAAAYSQILYETLKTDYENGNLSYEDYLVFSALNLFDPGKLPQTYQIVLADELPLKTGTFIVQEVKANWNNLSPESQKLLESYLSRPELPLSISSPSKKFRIHYSLTGAHQVSSEDNNKNNIPDYAEKAAEYFDYSHDVIVNQLGFQSPAPDSNGAGKEFDIYVVALNRTYGITWLENTVPGRTDAYSCYIEVDNDFTGFFTEPLGALQVTAAHEYFHAVQVSYRYRDDDVFFMEMCSTWMEDYAYPLVNDYILYLNNFFANINYPFYYTNGSWFEYGSSIWIHMIVKKYDAAVIRKVWELIPKQTAFTAIQDVLQQYGTTFNDELASFGVWNYFTGTRADTVQFYSEGHLYPLVRTTGDYFLKSQSLSIDEQMRKLSTVYFKVTNNLDQREIGLVITNFDIPSNNYLTSEQAPVNISLVSLQGGEDANETDFFIKNNLVKLYDGVGIKMEIPDSLVNSYRAQAVVDDGLTSNIVQFFPPPTSVAGDVSIYSIHPNPFIIGQPGALVIKYVISEPKPGKIIIFTENGQVVKQESFQSPLFQFTWDGRNQAGDFVSSGIYLVLLRAGSSIDMKKVAIIRK